MPKTTPRALAALLLLALSACDPGAVTGPDAASRPSLEVQVTGGLVGVDYGYQVTGSGAVIGGTCRRGCDWHPGDTLFRATPDQADALRALLERAPLPAAGDRVDYGTPCCDLPTFRLSLSAEGRTTEVKGALDSFPERIRALVRALHLAHLGVGPAVLDADRDVDGFSMDPVTVEAARIEGHALVVDVRYGGGCAPHDLDALVSSAWMESHPVQVGVTLTHHAHGDPCKALLHRTLRYDLDPVRRAYEASYGPGSATVVLQLRAASGGAGFTLPYVF